jgi:hypothetical protein
MLDIITIGIILENCKNFFSCACKKCFSKMPLFLVSGWFNILFGMFGRGLVSKYEVPGSFSNIFDNTVWEEFGI